MATRKKLKTPDVVWLFDTTHMTIYNWRKGAARKTRALPCDIAENGEVSFSASAVKKWAKENGLELRMDPAQYMEKGKPTPRKPGPKPKAVEASKPARHAKAGPKRMLTPPTRKATKRSEVDALTRTGNLAPDLSSEKPKASPRYLLQGKKPVALAPVGRAR